MKNMVLSKNEVKILERIRNSPNPEKTMDIMIGALDRLSAGEPAESIKSSYGTDWGKYITYEKFA